MLQSFCVSCFSHSQLYKGDGGKVTSQSLAEVIEARLAQSPHDGQTLGRAVLYRPEQLQVLREGEEKGSRGYVRIIIHLKYKRKIMVCGLTAGTITQSRRNTDPPGSP